MASKFKTGDRVRFLNDVGGGVVGKIEPNGMVFVLTDDGFDLPVQAKELVHAGGFAVAEGNEPASAGMKSMKPKESKKVEIVEELPKPAALPRNVSPDSAIKLLMGFIAENPGPVFSSKIESYLINDSGFNAYYVIGTWERGGYYYLSSGMVEANTKCFVASFDHTSLSKLTGMHIQAILLSDGKYNRKLPLDKIIDIGMVNFSKESYFRENDYFEEKAVIFPVSDEGKQVDQHDNIEVPEDVIYQKQDADNTRENPAKKREAVTDTLEVDLHMDESEILHSQYSLSGILALQLTRFHSAMEEALSKNMRRLVIIHGVGQGTLKMQIRKELQDKYPNFLFQDASFKEYGFGATMIHLISSKKQ
jgi:hypothetical protein